MNLSIKTLEYFYEKEIVPNNRLHKLTEILYPEVVKNYQKKYQGVKELKKMLSSFGNIDFCSLERFEDSNNPKITTENSGLYLIGNTVFDPTNYNTYYWVKVGAAVSNIKKRVSQYVTYNPMFYNIDSYIVENNPRKLFALEKGCHLVLSQIAITKKGQEWFMIDKDSYFDICEEGFSWFYL